MGVHTVNRGLDVPLAGAPRMDVPEGKPVRRVAWLARDFHGLKARVLVEQGARVKLGVPLVEDRERPGVLHVSPGTGTVEAIHRGERRALQSIVIALDAAEEQHAFKTAHGPADRASAQALLVESGLWNAIRVRPFSRVPMPGEEPEAILVNAMDSHPHAPPVERALEGKGDALARGLAVLRLFTRGPVFFCRAPGSALGNGVEGIRVEEFSGPHPAGTSGYHVHVLRPVARGDVVWTVTAEDVARMGHLFATGTLDVSTVISLAGPMVRQPRLLRTRLGASTRDLVNGELLDGESRVISGSVLHGDRAVDDVHAFLGRFHRQVSVVAEGRTREFLGWLAPGTDKFSILPSFLSAVMPGKRFAFDTNTHGGRRAMVPIGMYERVFPMDLPATHLLRALAMKDVEWAEELGALELDEEDLALCTFVCPGKFDWGAALRDVLQEMAGEG